MVSRSQGLQPASKAVLQGIMEGCAEFSPSLLCLSAVSASPLSWSFPEAGASSSCAPVRAWLSRVAQSVVH